MSVPFNKNVVAVKLTLIVIVNIELLSPAPPFCSGCLKNIWIEPSGIVDNSGMAEDPRLHLRRLCLLSLCSGRLPKFALANDMYLGDVPDELLSLGPVEESMIAFCRAKCWILQLQTQKNLENLEGDVNGFSHNTNCQRGFCGHVIVFPQKPEVVATELPPSIEDIAISVCVIFIGSTLPSRQ